MRMHDTLWWGFLSSVYLRLGFVRTLWLGFLRTLWLGFFKDFVVGFFEECVFDSQHWKSEQACGNSLGFLVESLYWNV